MNKLENFEMEKYQILNQTILDDDGTAHLEQIMKEILKEIIKEREEEEAKNQKKSYVLKKEESNVSFSVGTKNGDELSNRDQKAKSVLSVPDKEKHFTSRKH